MRRQEPLLPVGRRAQSEARGAAGGAGEGAGPRRLERRRIAALHGDSAIVGCEAQLHLVGRAGGIARHRPVLHQGAVPRGDGDARGARAVQADREIPGKPRAIELRLVQRAAGRARRREAAPIADGGANVDPHLDPVHRALPCRIGRHLRGGRRAGQTDQRSKEDKEEADQGHRALA